MTEAADTPEVVVDSALPVSVADVRAAASRLAGVATRTPLLASRALSEESGARVFLKCESLQRAGAFKFRGAFNRLSQLDAAERARGVVAFSSGNHAQGVALAARELGVRATIVMPSDAPPIKVEATRGYGAEVIVFDRQREDREAIAGALAKERGLVLVPPYDDARIIAGQGTVGLELLEQARELGVTLDFVVVPLGGGGLLSGIAVALSDERSIGLVGVETEAGDDWVRSLAAGRRVTIQPPDTIADGMRTLSPGELTFPIVRRLVRDVVTVSDREVAEAVRFLLIRDKLVVEPTGAVGAALLRSGRLAVRDLTVAVVISGGNVEPAWLAALLSASG